VQYTGQKDIIQHNILNKNTLWNTIYRTQRHYTAKYTRQKRFISHNIQHNILDKPIYTAQYTGQKDIT
jgi:hypothetical protein